MGLLNVFAPRGVLVADALSTDAALLLLNLAVGIFYPPKALEPLGEVREAKASNTPMEPTLFSDPADP